MAHEDRPRTLDPQDLGPLEAWLAGELQAEAVSLGPAKLLSGGAIGEDFDAFVGSTVSISGGSVGDGFDAHSGSTVNISGGSLGL